MGDEPAPEPDLRVAPAADAAAGPAAVALTARRSVAAMGPIRAVRSLRAVNQPEGFDCPGCAWPEPPPGARHHAEFCENGAKAVAEEATRARVDPSFFAGHPLDDLARRDDRWLGSRGRLTTPMVKHPGASNYVAIGWDEAFDLIAGELRSLAAPDEAVFYTSGRTSNEAAFAYQLLVRTLGTNNLPDCSNLCHEATGVALGAAIGVGKGSVRLSDFELADVILVVGQNPGTNHPRMLATLEAATRRGATIISINPLREAGLVRFRNPQTPRGMIGNGTAIADLHLPVRLGGDQALFQWFCRRTIDRERARGDAVDRRFVDDHTAGYDELVAHLDAVDPDELLAATGLAPDLAEAAFEAIVSAERLIVCWAMGITQHRNGVETIREITNLALLGGHIGRPGAGLCPVRGHSNVQGDRTMGIWERPTDAFLDRMETHFGRPMPRAPGHDVAAAIEAFAAGDAKVLFCLGGNFVRAAPDTRRVEAALASATLTVQVSTTLNRSHVACGRTAIILPTLGRTEIDHQAAGDQFVTVEDSMGMVHRSRGVLTPASPSLRSEVAIVCGLADRLFGADPVDWLSWRDDYSQIRSAIAEVIPGFERFEERVASPAGFELAHAPRDERRFPTATGAANFAVTHVADEPVAGVDAGVDGGDRVLLLQTLRSHDQYNTTIYGLDDRYRGVTGGRRVVMVNPADIERLGLRDGQRVDLVSHFDDGERRVRDFRVVAYDTPAGCAAAYFPETNPLIAVGWRSTESGTPASKAVPVTLEPTA